MLSIHPNSIQGYQLFHEGIQTFADVEQNGIPIDVDYCKIQYAILDRKINRLKKKIEKRGEVKKWKKIYRSKFNIDSNEQLSHMLFKELGYKPKVLTAKGNPSTSQEALEQIDSPLVEELTLLGRLNKARNTYIKNFLNEQVDGILHPFFNLHTVISYRSSSSNINFQNVPNRIKFIKELVRKALVSRPGYMIGEIDFSGVEVRVAGCYNNDPELIADILDPTRDMHRDMSKECYLLDDDEWTKATRQAAKNKFVFPQFYGDYYVKCAQSLWDVIHIEGLKTAKGVPLKKHLRSKGIGSYPRFESHLQEVEDYFWNERFKVYTKWKEAQWKEYQKNGYVDLKTGFRCSGFAKKNKVINYPIQGSAFHCLLWCLIRLHKWLKETGKKTQIIGQIHDSIVLMIWPEELNTILRKAYRIMEKEIRTHWPWIIVPLEVETEVTPVNGSWFLKKEIHKHKCKCGSHWMYKNNTGNSIIWECPICQKRI
jgi:DNA polymerase-1